MESLHGLQHVNEGIENCSTLKVVEHYYLSATTTQIKQAVAAHFKEACHPITAFSYFGMEII